MTIVGKIVSKEETGAHKLLSVDDGTGACCCKEYPGEESAEGANEVTFETNEYVRVTGKLKSWNDARYIQVMNCRKITDFNEVAFHFLDAMYASSDFPTRKVRAWRASDDGDWGGAGSVRDADEWEQPRCGWFVAGTVVGDL